MSNLNERFMMLWHIRETMGHKSANRDHLGEAYKSSSWSIAKCFWTWKNLLFAEILINIWLLHRDKIQEVCRKEKVADSLWEVFEDGWTTGFVILNNKMWSFLNGYLWNLNWNKRNFICLEAIFRCSLLLLLFFSLHYFPLWWWKILAQSAPRFYPCLAIVFN